MFRSKLSLAVLVFLLSVFSINAQTDTLSYRDKFEFMFINGYSIAYSKNITPCSLLRYKLDLNLSWNNENGDVNRETSNITSDQTTNTTSKYDADENSDTEEISFTVQYLWLYELGNKVDLFAGAGPTIGYSRNHSNNKYNYPNSIDNPYSNEDDYTSSGFNVGLFGSCGVQCQVTENLSIIAEYDLLLRHIWKNTDSESTYESQVLKNIQKSETDIKSWDFSLSSIKLGVGFRF